MFEEYCTLFLQKLLQSGTQKYHNFTPHIYTKKPGTQPLLHFPVNKHVFQQKLQNAIPFARVTVKEGNLWSLTGNDLFVEIENIPKQAQVVSWPPSLSRRGSTE